MNQNIAVPHIVKTSTIIQLFKNSLISRVFLSVGSASLGGQNGKPKKSENGKSKATCPAANEPDYETLCEIHCTYVWPTQSVSPSPSPSSSPSPKRPCPSCIVALDCNCRRANSGRIWSRKVVPVKSRDGENWCRETSFVSFSSFYMAIFS